MPLDIREANAPPRAWSPRPGCIEQAWLAPTSKDVHPRLEGPTAAREAPSHRGEDALVSPKSRQHSSWDGLGPVSVVHVNRFSPVHRVRVGGCWFSIALVRVPLSEGRIHKPLAVPSPPQPHPKYCPAWFTSTYLISICWVHPPVPLALPPLLADRLGFHAHQGSGLILVRQAVVSWIAVRGVYRILVKRLRTDTDSCKEKAKQVLQHLKALLQCYST